MRIYRNAIILVVIMALLAGVYVFAKNKKTDTEPKTEAPKVEKLWDIDREKITEVSVTGKDGKFVFVKKDKDWTLSSPESFKADKSKIESIVSNISTLAADKVIEENASDIAKYGLDKPTEIAVKYDAGTKTLEIGDMTSTKDAYYIKEKGTSKVYTLGTYTGDVLKADKNSLRDKTLFTVKPEDILGVSMSKSSNLIFSSRKIEEAQWVLKAPIEGNADASAIQPIVEGIVANSSYMNFVEEKPADLDKYGLKNPSYSLEFETASGKTSLLLGQEKEKGKEIYAKLANGSDVFTIDESPLTFLDKPLKEIMEVFAYIVNIQDVSKITVELDGKTTVSELQTDKDDKDKDKFTVDGKDATNAKDDKDNQLFRKYYQALIGVTMDEIDTAGKPTGKPEITFTYSLKKDPGTMKVEFIPKDSNYYYVVKNGKYANLLVLKKKFDQPEALRDYHKKLMDALNK